MGTSESMTSTYKITSSLHFPLSTKIRICFFWSHRYSVGRQRSPLLNYSLHQATVKMAKKKKKVSIKAVCKPKEQSNLRKISEDDYAYSRELCVCAGASGLEKQYVYMLDLP